MESCPSAALHPPLSHTPNPGGARALYWPVCMQVFVVHGISDPAENENFKVRYPTVTVCSPRSYLLFASLTDVIWVCRNLSTC